MASYPAFVEWDENAGAYGAVFPDLDIAAVGITLEETLANAEETLQDYIVDMEKRGWHVAAPSSPENVDVPQGNELVSIPLRHPSELSS